MTRQKKGINVLILKHDCNYERMIEKIHRVWLENTVANDGLKEMWNGHVMLVEKTEGKLLQYSRI